MRRPFNALLECFRENSQDFLRFVPDKVLSFAFRIRLPGRERSSLCENDARR